MSFTKYPPNSQSNGNTQKISCTHRVHTSEKLVHRRGNVLNMRRAHHYFISKTEFHIQTFEWDTKSKAHIFLLLLVAISLVIVNWNDLCFT